MTIEKYDQSFKKNVILALFTRIFTVFTNLIYLNLYKFARIDIDPFPNGSAASVTFSSSTLMELHVNVGGFGDCLYLLDGRFDQLRSFYIKISIISTLMMDPLLKLNKVSYF